MSIDDKDAFAGIIESSYDTIGAFYTEPVKPRRELIIEVFTELLAELDGLHSAEHWSFLRDMCARIMHSAAPIPQGSTLLVADPMLVITERGAMPVDPTDRIIGTFQVFIPDELVVCGEIDLDKEPIFTPTGDAALYAVLADAYLEMTADGTRIPLGETEVSLSNGKPELHYAHYIS